VTEDNRTPEQRWADGVDDAIDRWANSVSEISLDQWRNAMVAKASTHGGIGSKQWRRACRRAALRGWARHPLRNALGWVRRRIPEDWT